MKVIIFNLFQPHISLANSFRSHPITIWALKKKYVPWSHGWLRLRDYLQSAIVKYQPDQTRFFFTAILQFFCFGNYEAQMRKMGRTEYFPAWWLNQPIWKICASQMGSFPQGSGWKYKKNIWKHGSWDRTVLVLWLIGKVLIWNHHLVSYQGR